MPEGHVTHRLATALTGAFTARSVAVVSPQGRFAESAGQLDGTTLTGAESVGKHLFVTFAEERVVWIHLGLIGRLTFGPADQLPHPATLRLRISDGVLAADLRGPQWCRLITTAEQQAVIEQAGSDPLRPDADPARAWARVACSGRPFAAVLMDQKVFAGVGNIFRAEVLFRHGIDPWVPANAIPQPVFCSVWADLAALMNAAVASGRIDSVDAAHTPEAMGRPPREDRHGGEVYVYRRTGQACLVCGGEILVTDLAGRNLYWCGTCQPPGARGRPR
ncbi:MAG: Fpg/Nei family DNA glycosylase [Propioniciclava sp.]